VLAPAAPPAPAETAAAPTQEPAPAEEEDDAAALMDCTQTATLGDWNPNLPCTAYELPDTAPKAKPKPEKATVVAALEPTDTAKPAKPAKSKSAAKAETAKPKPATKAATAKSTKAKPTQVASAKDAQKPAKKKKKKKPTDDDGSCVQGASSIADWNPNLPCASGQSAASMKLLDVPPAL
jgi:hypothetical protein